MHAFHPIVFGYLTPRRVPPDAVEPGASRGDGRGEERAPLKHPAEVHGGSIGSEPTGIATPTS